MKLYFIHPTWKHYVAVSFAVVVLLTDFTLFFNFLSNFGPAQWYFSPILVIGVFVGIMPFIQDYFAENTRQKEMEVKFLEFVRTLVETVRSGVTIPQAILHVKTSGADYGALTPYTTKLANQIEWGFPLHQALLTFGKDTLNPVIRRSIGIVIQAEKSGGDMAAVLEAVSGSVLEIKKLRDEQKSNAYGQIIQGYIIFFVFLSIMIIMQVWLIPKLSDIAGDVSTSLSGSFGSGGGSPTAKKSDLGVVFTETIIVQGLFAGLMIGKFAEGKYGGGIKHSLIMVIGGYLVITTVIGLFGTTAVAPVAKAGLFLLFPRLWEVHKRVSD